MVTIEELTPGELPRRGAIEVSGEVANRDVETWRDVNLHAFVNDDACLGCPPPITTAAELEAAAATDPEAVVGNRIVQVSDTVPELRPGEVATFSIRIPRRYVEITQAGVYWFGVHALGSSDTTPRDSLADGRARTFLPYLPQGRDGVTGSVDTAVVVPLRHRIEHHPSGAIARRSDWRADLGPYGRLGGPLSFGAAALDRPVTWLVDPAVPDAVRRLGEGNPPRDLGPLSEDAREPEEPDETGEPGSETPSTDGPDGEGSGEAPPPTDPTATLARSWLDRLERALQGEEVLALPYGDVDVSATASSMPELYALARDRAGDVLAEWEVETRPAIASPGGYLDPRSLDEIDELDDSSMLLLTDRMFAADTGQRGDDEAEPQTDATGIAADAPGAGRFGGHEVAVTASAAATGGPGPDPRLDAVSLRQRVLAEAALRLLRSPDAPEPLVVVVDPDVTGEGATRFWSGLDLDWVDLGTASDAVAGASAVIDPDELSYPAEARAGELGPSLFYELGRLVAAGETLQNVLIDSEGVAGEVRDEALTSASYASRTAPDAAERALVRSRGWIERRLAEVTIDGPPGVTLSSADGTFSATLENLLDRTVTVRIEATSPGGRVRVDAGEPIVLTAGSRTTVLLEAHTSDPGVHNVTLAVTDVDGTPIGATDQLPVRSNQVSDVIWVILGVGFGILVLAIVLRLLRRFRQRGAAT
ncbi:DUF6049 family protein [Nocardioides sp. TF02-7]|nr:DUF6049 family protein [Nocardioides sp. TF02-7]